MSEINNIYHLNNFEGVFEKHLMRHAQSLHLFPIRNLPKSGTELTIIQEKT